LLKALIPFTYHASLRPQAHREEGYFPECVEGFYELRRASFSTTRVKKRVLCRDVSLGRTGAVPAPSDTTQALRLPYMRLCVLHHQGRALVHDGVAHARRKPEMCQLRHDGHRRTLAGGGQALRLRRTRKLLASRQDVPASPSSTPMGVPNRYSRPFCMPLFTEVRGRAILRTSALRRSRKFAATSNA
jgi:hypothetical protein